MKYTTTSVLALAAGVALGLTKEQATLRKHVLQPIPRRKDWYLTTGEVQFKIGETFLADDAMPKHLADGVETAEEVAARQAEAERKEEAERKAAEEAAAAQAEAEAKAKAEAEAKAKAEAEAKAKADGNKPPTGA